MASKNMSRMLVGSANPMPRIAAPGPLPNGGFTRVSAGVYRGPNGQLIHSTQNPTSLAPPMQPKPAMPPQAPIGASGPNTMGGVFGQASPQPAPTYGQNPWAQFGSPNAGAMRPQFPSSPPFMPSPMQNQNQMQPLFAQGGGQAGQYDPSSGSMAAANGAVNQAMNQLAGSPTQSLQPFQQGTSIDAASVAAKQAAGQNPQFQTTGNV